MSRKVSAEFAGTLMLAMVVVGSGIMGARLTSDVAVALIVNAVSTVLALYLLITLLGPISGAHFNPAVSLIELIQRRISAADFIAYVVAQTAGAVVGVVGAHTMYGLPPFSVSTHLRDGFGMFLGEFVATAGLIFLIMVLACRQQSHLTAVAVAGWIGSAYFFTSSTSFANPALTIARMFTETFAGIAVSSVALFIFAQIAGSLAGFVLAKVATAGSSHSAQ